MPAGVAMAPARLSAAPSEVAPRGVSSGSPSRASSRPTSAPALSRRQCAARRHRTSARRGGFRAGSRHGRAPARLPRRHRPCAGLLCRTSSTPTCRAGSSSTSTRSARWTRTCGSPVRAVTFQSMSRTSSSPGTYVRTWASSVPRPSTCARWSPESRPSRGERRLAQRTRSWSVRIGSRALRVRSGPPGGAAIGRFRPMSGGGGVGKPGGSPTGGAGGQRRSCHALPPQVELGHGDGGDDLVEQRIGTALLGQRLVREHEPVAEGVLDELLDVSDERVVASAEVASALAPCVTAIGPRGWRRRRCSRPAGAGRRRPAAAWP